MSEETKEPENDVEIDETVLLHRDNYLKLLELISEYRNDLGQLVGVFQHFTVLFSGKSALTMVPTLMKLINDPKQLEAFKHILPIIEKYSPKPLKNGENNE